VSARGGSARSLARAGHLVRARFGGMRRSGWPIPAMVFLAALSAVLASLAGEILPPFPYVFLALSLGPLVLGLPILSDLSGLLRHDEALEWIASLPALPVERLLARAAHLLVWLAGLALAWFLPWSFFGPPGLDRTAAAILPVAGFVLAIGVGAILVWTQQLLLQRWGWALVALETAWMVFTVVGILRLLGHLPEIASLTPETPGLTLVPSYWFARALTSGAAWSWALLAMAVPCALALLAVPAVEARAPSTRAGLERWLAPLRWLAVRHWVRAQERGTFDLVYAGPGREREFALRTYPLLGIPLAFLWLAASGGSGTWRSDVLALLLFTAGVSLPLLLIHLPLTESPEAVWIQRVAPCPDRPRQEGAIKAVFVRWVAPLYLGLLGLGIGLGRGGEVLRLWPPAVLLALLLIRRLYPLCVRDLPLSTAPEDLRSDLDWAGGVTGMALALTVVAVLANRYLDWGTSALVTLALLTLEGWRLRGHVKGGRVKFGASP